MEEDELFYTQLLLSARKCLATHPPAFAPHSSILVHLPSWLQSQPPLPHVSTLAEEKPRGSGAGRPGVLSPCLWKLYSLRETPSFKGYKEAHIHRLHDPFPWVQYLWSSKQWALWDFLVGQWAETLKKNPHNKTQVQNQNQGQVSFCKLIFVAGWFCFVSFCFCFVCFETGFLYVALAVPELTG